MQITAARSIKERKKADLLVIPFWQTKKKAESAFKNRELLALSHLPVDAGDFQGKEGEVLILYRAGRSPGFLEKRLVLLGLGEKKELSLETLRRAYASLTRAVRRKKCKSINLLLPLTELAQTEMSNAIFEGVFLANYSFDQFKKDDKNSLIDKLCLIDADKESLALCKKSSEILLSVHFARDLVNGNADEVNAQSLSLFAKELGKKFSTVKTTILGKKELEKEKMGLLLAVNQGASRDPALILMEYKGDPKSKDWTAIVGKGVSFDTGGLNLKPTGGIETMKCDMAGAAAVLATMRAAAALGVKKNILGVIAAVENAIGPMSYKPGDVVTSYSKKTVEITNTDAEGRLILADALSYVQDKFSVNRIIDLATLTGGIVVALGEEVTGLFCNDDKLAQDLFVAGEATYERLWRFPLYAEYKDALKSPIADLKNSAAGRKASSITAAIFLESFIKKGMPWAHLDIAGTAYLSELKNPYHPSLATGVGVRLLISFLS